MHFDADDALNVQLIGRKRWRLAPNACIDAPMSGASAENVSARLRRDAHTQRWPRAMPEEHVTIDVAPGQAVWLPRGWWHDTTVTGRDPSLAMVFGLVAPTLAAAWTDALRRHLERDAMWRRRPHGGAGSLAQRQAWLDRLEHAFANAPPPARVIDAVLDLVSPLERTFSMAIPEDSVTFEGSKLRAVDATGRAVVMRIPERAPALIDVARWITTRCDPFRGAELVLWARTRTGHPVERLTSDALAGLVSGMLAARILIDRA